MYGTVGHAEPRFRRAIAAADPAWRFSCRSRWATCDDQPGTQRSNLEVLGSSAGDSLHDRAQGGCSGADAQLAEPKNALIERLFAAHRGALQAFFHRRVQPREDATDLAQEVYVRMLRLKNLDSIRDTEAYLYTVASNLAREHAVRERRRGVAVDIESDSADDALAELATFDAQIDSAQQVRRLRAVLRQFPLRWHAAVVLHYEHGPSYEEIAERIGVSQRMVKKYLGRALGHCRRRMAGGLTR